MKASTTNRFTFLASAAAIVFFAAAASATPTTVVVHVVARDAKIVGTHVGGARVTIRDAKSHRVLAEGVQMGETGDTAKIMKEPHVRGNSLYTTDKAAAFAATLDITQPATIEITAEGPLKYPQAMQKAVKTMRIVPGQNIGGDGVVLELNGLVIDLLEPVGSVAAGDVALKFKVMMMCGCPVDPGGLWDASKMTVIVKLSGRRGVVREVAATPVGSSTFTATLPAIAAGRYTIDITAADPASANFGTFTKKLKVVK